MTDHDYDVIKRAAYDEASAFFRDAESSLLDDGYAEIWPGLFSEMLYEFPQYEAADISQVIDWGIRDAWYDVLRSGYGYIYHD